MKRKDVAFVRFTNLQNVSVWKDLGQSCKGNGMRKIDQMNVFQVLYWIVWTRIFHMRSHSIGETRFYWWKINFEKLEVVAYFILF